MFAVVHSARPSIQTRKCRVNCFILKLCNTRIVAALHFIIKKLNCHRKQREQTCIQTLLISNVMSLIAKRIQSVWLKNNPILEKKNHPTCVDMPPLDLLWFIAISFIRLRFTAAPSRLFYGASDWVISMPNHMRKHTNKPSDAISLTLGAPKHSSMIQ